LKVKLKEGKYTLKREEITIEEAKQIISKISSQGKINYEEFKKWFLMGSKNISKYEL